MSEEIIVNGTNVTSYEFLSESIICKSLENPNQICPDYDNCYFKKLKRLQEENEELKNRLKTLDDEEFVINEYKQAFEEIKETILNYESKERNCFNDMDAKLEKISKILNELDEVLNDRD